MSSSSSLQRAAGFETCFAAGLDLSEFGSSPSSVPQSHAAALLQIKKREAAQEAQNDAEEARLDQVILLNNQQRRKGPPATNVFRALAPTAALQDERALLDAKDVFSVLTSMHGSDEHGGKKRTMTKKKSGKKNGAQRRMDPKASASRLKAKKKKSPATTATKKSMRRKY